MAAPGYGRMLLSVVEMSSQTDGSQITPASNMWEYLMLTKHSFGQANRAAWRHGVPGHDARTPGESSAQARRREREQKIERAVAALAKLDDRTLLGLGIPHRSHIEWIVRYCHDC